MGLQPICYDEAMRKTFGLFLALALAVLCVARVAVAQDAQGALDFVARITPTAARPEPVRQFTFYLLTKSYADIWQEVEARDAVPPARNSLTT